MSRNIRNEYREQVAPTADRAMRKLDGFRIQNTNQGEDRGMKRLAFATAFMLIATIGCSGQKETAKGEGGKELKVTAPGNTSIDQGESKEITVKIKREKFEDPVKVEFSQLPDGVKITESDMTIDKGATEKTFTLKADPKAKPEDNHKVKVSASAGEMKAGPVEFTVNVKEKK
jgi:hypothetical protein